MSRFSSSGNDTSALVEWVRLHKWGVASLDNALHRYRQELDFLQAEFELFPKRVMLDECDQKKLWRDFGQSEKWIDDKIATMKAAPRHFRAAQSEFPRVTPAKLILAMEQAAELETEQRTTAALETLDDLFWSYALAVAWIATDGNEDLIRKVCAEGLRTRRSVLALYDDERWDRNGLAEVLTNAFKIEPKTIREAEHRLLRAARRGEISAAGLPGSVATTPVQLKPHHWIDLELRKDPQNGRFRFRGPCPIAVSWEWIRFDASQVRQLVNECVGRLDDQPTTSGRGPGRPRKGGPNHPLVAEYCDKRDRGEKVLQKEFAAKAQVATSTFAGWCKKFRNLKFRTNF